MAKAAPLNSRSGRAKAEWFTTLGADLRHMTATWGQSSSRCLLRAVPRVLLQSRFRGLLLYRLSQVSPGPVAQWLQSRVLRCCGAELHSRSRIGPGLCLVHTTGLVVGAEVRAGSDLVLYQNVTLGHGKSGIGQPVLGDRVRIFVGAAVLGNISVGDDVVIGAHALVLADVPAGTRVVGVWK